MVIYSDPLTGAIVRETLEAFLARYPEERERPIDRSETVEHGGELCGTCGRSIGVYPCGSCGDPGPLPD
jgi:hypothetical protein